MLGQSLVGNCREAPVITYIMVNLTLHSFSGTKSTRAPPPGRRGLQQYTTATSLRRAFRIGGYYLACCKLWHRVALSSAPLEAPPISTSRIFSLLHFDLHIAANKTVHPSFFIGE